MPSAPRIARATLPRFRIMITPPYQPWVEPPRSIKSRRMGTLPPVSLANLWNRSSLAGGPQQLRARVRVGSLAELLVEAALLVRQGGRHDDLDHEEQITPPARRGRQALSLKTKLAARAAGGRHLPAHRLGQGPGQHPRAPGPLPPAG